MKVKVRLSPEREAQLKLAETQYPTVWIDMPGGTAFVMGDPAAVEVVIRAILPNAPAIEAYLEQAKLGGPSDSLPALGTLEVPQTV